MLSSILDGENSNQYNTRLEIYAHTVVQEYFSITLTTEVIHKSTCIYATVHTVGRFSPMSDIKKKFEFSRIPTASEIDPNQNLTTLNVPNSSWCHPSGSTSPSLSSPLSSPSMTPRSPLSPPFHNTPMFSESFDSGNSSRKQSDSSQSRHTVDSTHRHNANHSNRNSFEFCDGQSFRSQEDTEDDISNLGDEDLSSISCDSIEDKGQRPRGRRPPPMIVSQDELPDFVAALSPRNSLKRLLESRLESEDRYHT